MKPVPWSTYYPDLNSIEKQWDEPNARVHKRGGPLVIWIDFVKGKDIMSPALDRLSWFMAKEGFSE